MPRRAHKSRRVGLALIALLAIFVLGSLALAAVPDGSAAGTIGAPSHSPTVSPTALVTASGTPLVSTSGFQPIGIYATPAPELHLHPEFHETDAPWVPGTSRPSTEQSAEWLLEKDYGRVAVIDGRIGLLDPATNPMLAPGTGQPVETARTLDLDWSRWIVEPPGGGSDERGTDYVDISYWNLCGPGATTVLLYYWQQILGYPNVTGTEGWFLDPYEAEGAAWPSPGPIVAAVDGKPIGTYWSGSDTVSGFNAHGRGFILHMAMQTQPPTWRAPGISVWADAYGNPLYPTRGASREEMQAGLNWEISGHDPKSWVDTWYSAVDSNDGALARDLLAAVTLDVGRDGVPVLAAADTFDLPNWQNGGSTPHIRHAISIVGYDNTANPPTYTYLDTCGHSCNARGGNGNGQVHVIAQSAMVEALQDEVGIGFLW